MGQPARIVHYVNQFFGGIGGEDKADTPLKVREGPVGPGRALQQILGAQGTVVATLICGDDYVAEREDEAGAAIREALGRHRAGPRAGRPGVRLRPLRARLRPDLPGRPVARHPRGHGHVSGQRRHHHAPARAPRRAHRASIASEMKAILARMAGLGLRLARGETLGSAAEEGYIPRGIRRLVVKDKVGYERAVDMLLARVAGRPVASEIQVQQYDRVPPAPPVRGPRARHHRDRRQHGHRPARQPGPPARRPRARGRALLDRRARLARRRPVGVGARRASTRRS